MTADQDDLAPCPFCGNPAKNHAEQESSEGDCRLVFHVGCCAWMSEPGPWGYPRKGDHESKDEARLALARRWNSRAILALRPGASAQTVDRLMQVFDQLPSWDREYRDALRKDIEAILTGASK